FFARTLVAHAILVSSLVASAIDDGDMFANRPAIVGSAGAITGTTVGASRGDGEPLHPGLAGTGSVWRSWTAPATGDGCINTFNSEIDTVLAVYTGDSLETLVEVSSNDDYYPPSILQSMVKFKAQKGVTYAIAVDGANAQGN